MLALASRATQLVAHRGLATASALPRKVKIYELGPRDGLQNEATQVPTDVKIEFINRLSEVGASVVEPTSFVSPKWVPQMGDHKEVLAGITMRPGVSYPVLVPNMRGFKDSVAGGAKAVAVLCMPSETFASKNLNMSVAQATERCLAIVEEAVGQSIPVRGYISCALGCPFEGPMDPKAVASLAKQLHEAGCYEIALSDTIGAGTPGDMELLLREVLPLVPVEKLAVHCHDTYGQALANILTALQHGVATVDSSVAGLGGCPFAGPGAAGNVATEDVVYMLHGLGIDTGVDFRKAMEAGEYILSHLNGRPNSSRAAIATLKRGR